MENDNELLPAITIVEYGPYDTQFWRILVDAPWRRTRYISPTQYDPLNYTTPPDATKTADMVSELASIYTTLNSALDYAAQYLYNFAQAGYVHPSGHPITDLPPSRQKRTPRERMADYRSISLSPPAWEYIKQETARLHYDGRGYTGGTNKYLKALIEANPTTDCWTDTRPDYLKEFDHERLSNSQVPYWYLYDSPADYRRARLLNRDNWDNCLEPTLIQLSNHFMIIPPYYSTWPRSRAASALEAIGLQYLTPANPAPFNPHPPKKYSGYQDPRRRRSSWELSF